MPLPRKHRIITGGRATIRYVRIPGPAQWIPCALLVAALLFSALLALPWATQSAQAAPPPNPGSIYFLSYCSNGSQTTPVNTAFSEKLSVCVGKWADVGAPHNHVA